MFLLHRLFPMMADFSKANNLSSSIEFGLLSCLYHRLFRSGMTKEDVMALLDMSHNNYLAAIKAEAEEDQTAPPPSTPEAAAQQDNNVFIFKKKQ